MNLVSVKGNAKGSRYPKLKPKGFVSPALAGKTHRDRVVPCCCLLMLSVKTVKHLALISTYLDGFQPKLGHIFICPLACLK